MNVDGASAITAVTRNGQILLYDGSTKFDVIDSDGSNYTGGMSIWMENVRTSAEGVSPETWEWKSTLLLLGVQSRSSYSKGYREISLDSAGKPTAGVRVPGSRNPSSVTTEDRKKYDASLARYSVFYLLQVPGAVEAHSNTPGWQPVIFASTANNGLQSLRDGLWNAEE
jgi:hypothetical protein